MRSFTAILCALVLSQAAFAQHYSSTFEISTQLFSFNYKEVWTPPAKSNETGFIPGVALAYTYRGYKLPLYARASFEYTRSQTNYEGVLFLDNGGMIPQLDKSRNSFTRLEVQAGYGFRLGRQLSLTPYTGYGYRAWTRILSDPGGYEENYYWSYIPVGVRGDLQIGRTISLGLDAAMRFMFGGGMLMHLYDNPTLDLGNKIGFKFSLPSTFRLSPHWGLGIEPYLEFSGINESKPHFVTRDFYVYEPESSTSIFGTHVTLQYSF